MIIAVVSDVLGEENNGTTIAAMNLIRSLKAKGHEVRVICPDADKAGEDGYYIVKTLNLSLIHISEPTRLGMISYAVFCLKKKNASGTTGVMVCRNKFQKALSVSISDM